MALVIAEFFGIIGVDMTPPQTMAEFIPWMFFVYIGIVLVCAVFRVIGKLVEMLLNWRKT